MEKQIARFVSVLFHPVLIPTLGMILLFRSGFYFSTLSWEATRFVLLVVFFSTCILPLLSIAGLAFNPKFDISLENHRDRVFPLLSSALFYYLGYMLLAKANAFQIFKLFMLASVFLILVLLVISFYWKISNHTAAMGALTGTLLSLSFRTGNNPVLPIVLVILVSGVVSSARLILNKHDIWQILAGYGLGILVFYLVIFFI